MSGLVQGRGTNIICMHGSGRLVMHILLNMDMTCTSAIYSPRVRLCLLPSLMCRWILGFGVADTGSLYMLIPLCSFDLLLHVIEFVGHFQCFGPI